MSNTIVSPSPSPQLVPEEYSTIPTQAQIAAEFGGDSAAQLAAMVFLFSRERSRTSAEQRDRIETQIGKHENAQVKKMHDSADAMYEAGRWQAYGQIAGGLLSAVGSASGEGWGEALSAGGNALQGTTNLIATEYKHAADFLSADAEHAGNKAGSYERSLETVNSDAEDAKGMKDAVYDFLQAVQNTKAETDKALVNIRA